MASEWGLRVSVERLTIAPRDIAAPPDEAECCFLVTVTGPEGGTVARLAFVTSLEARPPELRDALWWIASDAWSIERSGGNLQRWAAMHRLTGNSAVAEREFAHYSAQARSLKAALGPEAYRRLVAAYDAEVTRGGASVESTIEPRPGTR